MLRLIGLVVSIGLADSLNPTTIAPAMYLATGERPRRQVTEFTLGVIVVYLAGGILIALGPGQLLLSLVPKPDAEDRHVIEIVVKSEDTKDPCEQPKTAREVASLETRQRHPTGVYTDCEFAERHTTP